MGVLIVGASASNWCLDDGAWWQHLGAMTGNNAEAHVTLIGSTKRQRSGLSPPKQRKPAVTHESLKDFLRDRSIQEFDLAVVVSPWLSLKDQEDLGRHLSLCEVPLLVVSEDKAQELLDTALLEAMGFVVRPSVPVPHGTGLPEAAVWSFDAVAGQSVQPDRLEEIARAARTMANLRSAEAGLEQGHAPHEADMGQARHMDASLAPDDLYVRLLRDLYVREATGRISKVEKGFMTEVDISVPDVLLSRRPANDAPWVDRCIWAAEVWEQCAAPAIKERVTLDLRPGKGATQLMGRGWFNRFDDDTLAALADAIPGPKDLLQKAVASLKPPPDRLMTEAERKLFWAIEQGDELRAIEILKSNSWAHPPTTHDHTPLLHAAISAQMAALCLQALQMGFDPSATDAEGWPAVVHAASLDAPVFIRLLCEHKAAIDQPTPFGWTALNTALSRKHWEAARELLLCGANPTAPDAAGRTAKAFTQIPGMPADLRRLLA